MEVGDFDTKGGEIVSDKKNLEQKEKNQVQESKLVLEPVISLPDQELSETIKKIADDLKVDLRDIEVPNGTPEMLSFIANNPMYFHDERLVDTAIKSFEYAPDVMKYLHTKGESDLVEKIISSYASDPETFSRSQQLSKRINEENKRNVLQERLKVQKQVQDMLIMRPELPQNLRNPLGVIPDVDSKYELALLKAGENPQSQRNELQRSSFNRIPSQVSFIKEVMPEMPKDFKILNVGPANLEEASTVFMIAEDSSKKPTITYVDVQPIENIKPDFLLKKNVLTGENKKPSSEIIEHFVETSDGYVVNNETSQRMLDTLKNPGNFFGTAVEHYLKSGNDENKYDIVTFNNVAQYLGRGDVKYPNPTNSRGADYSIFTSVLLGVSEKTKVGGILLMNCNDGKELFSNLLVRSNFTDVFEVVDFKHGIYKRKSDQALGIA